MTYYISDTYGCVYYLQGNLLCWCPLMRNNTFNTDEGGAVETDHDEVPAAYYDKVRVILKGV